VAKDQWWLFGAYAAGVVAVLCGIWLAIVWSGSWAAMAAPRTWEKKIGETAMRQLEGMPTCGNRDLYLAVQSMARRLSATVPAGEVEFNIRVADEPILNAVTFPGGYILLFRGLLEAADTPEELAGVMAHEMQHAVQRHSMKALGRGAALWVLIGVLTGGADASTAGAAGRLAGMRMQREDEFDADAGALAMLEAAKISSEGFLSFFEKLQRKEAEVPWLASAFATHPETAARIERIRQWQASHKGAVQPVMEVDSWRRVRLSCGAP
jgi:predicted Zn-dependent protease